MQLRVRQILRSKRAKGKPYLLIGLEGKMTTCVLEMREEHDWKEVEVVLADERPVEVGEKVGEEVAMYGMPGGLSDAFAHPDLRRLRRLDPSKVTITGRKGVWPKEKL